MWINLSWHLRFSGYGGIYQNCNRKQLLCVSVKDKSKGVNGYKVCSSNMMNKIYVTLVGFWKQCDNDERNFQCISVSQNNIPITAAG